MPVVVVFDLDSTLIEMETIDELAKLCGKYEQCAAITDRAMNGLIDFEAALRERCALLKGMDWRNAWRELVRKCILAKGAEEVVRILHNTNHRIILASGGSLPLTRFIASRVGIGEYYGNELEISDNKLTGRLTNHPIINAEFKESLVMREREKVLHRVVLKRAG